MGLIAFASAVLTRNRDKVVNLLEADVFLAKGNLDGYTFPTTKAEFDAGLSDPFKTIGVNTKDSPDYKIEPIAEEVDYEEIQQAVKVSGNIKVKLINDGLLTFFDKEMLNQECTILIVPKDYDSGDEVLYINGVRLKYSLEGKSNSEETPVATLSFMKKAKEIGDVIKISDIPA